MKKHNPLTYAASGIRYDVMDPFKKLAQQYAKKTALNLNRFNASEVSKSRGESAYVWEEKDCYRAFVIEGLGTKNLVADAMRKTTGKTYYDVLAQDTVAMIVNDLITLGAIPQVINAYFAVGNSNWFTDEQRVKDLIEGWVHACNLAGATWGGGETPTQKGIINDDTIDLAGSAIGIIKPKKNLISSDKLQKGDRILLLRSNGINANGLSLARAIAKKLPKGYLTKLPDGVLYGDALLTKTNIYASLIQELLDAGIAIHYISNITGHGLRKVMRARQTFTYVIEKLFDPQEVFLFMQKHAGLSNEEAYGTFNMGQDYAIFLAKNDVKKAKEIIQKNKFQSLDAGYVDQGKKQVILTSKRVTYTSESLDLR